MGKETVQVRQAKVRAKVKDNSLNIHWVRIKAHILLLGELRTTEAPGQHTWSISLRPKGLSTYNEGNRQKRTTYTVHNMTKCLRSRATEGRRFRVGVEEMGEA